MNDQPLIVQMGPPVPYMTVEMYAKYTGLKVDYIREEVRAGNIQTKTDDKKGPNQKVVINAAYEYLKALTPPDPVEN